MWSRGRYFPPTSPWALPRFHSLRGHWGAPVPKKGRPRFRKSTPTHPQPYLSLETLDPDFSASRRAGFTPFTASQAPRGTVQYNPEAAEIAGTERSDTHLPASPMAASVRTSRGSRWSPTPLLPNTNPRRPRPIAAPPKQPITKRHWSHVQNRRSVPTLQLGL